MYVVCVTVWVKDGFAEQFIEATLENHRATRQEAGNLRFDVARGADDANRFHLYEVYQDEAAFKTHQTLPHYFAWRERVADWMAQPRQGVKYVTLAPEEPGKWRG